MHHITQWLNQLSSISTNEGRDIEIYQLNHQQDPTILSAWAKHFREHYCPDDIIDALISGTGFSRKDYLKQIIFPDQRIPPGPSIRSGDFGELLVTDYLQFSLNYWVPRLRMKNKAVRNESINCRFASSFCLINFKDTMGSLVFPGHLHSHSLRS